MSRFLREPLVHFVLFAGLIFLAYGWLGSRGPSGAETIIVSQSDIERMAALYTVEAGTLPGERDMQGMIIDHIQQQALAREARKLGMADGDTVVERRLAQKMTFMLSDMDETVSPEEAELEAWYTAHKSQFAEPARWSFQHVYFAEAADPRIAESLEALSTDPSHDWRGLGDPFMLQSEYSELPPREITRLFGSDFMSVLARSETDIDVWQGPVTSALGTHLVRIRKSSEPRLPGLEEIRPAVLAAWREEARQAQTANAIQAVVDSYDVVIETGPDARPAE